MTSQNISRLALVGNPNTGKTALFNALTGSHQKVANYAGVTVEKKEGTFTTPEGRSFILLDLPGTYSLDAASPDEEVTRDILCGRFGDEPRPDMILVVADATNLERSLNLVLELKELNVPMVVALNMMDLAQRRGLVVDLEVLMRELDVPVVSTIATHKHGVKTLLKTLDRIVFAVMGAPPLPGPPPKGGGEDPKNIEVVQRFHKLDGILSKAVKHKTQPDLWSEKIDRMVLHPVWGSLILTAVLFFLFQAIFTFAEAPMNMIEGLVTLVGQLITKLIPAGPLQSLLVDGIVAGVGSVLIFLPQILILFFFIIILEDSGYLARGAFLMDKLMSRVGLSGRAFIPLLSSYACAIPGIMAARTIDSPRDRLTMIMIAPLATCSARLPIYSLLIATFIPSQTVYGLNLQGLVLFGLYAAGLLSALLVAGVLKGFVLKGAKPLFLMELPTYKSPSAKNVVFGLWQRGGAFLKRAGTLIMGISILLWFLSSYPKPPEGATEPAIAYSFAGRLGHALEPLVRPIGFDWRIATGLVPGFAAREVMVSALATVFAVGADEEESTLTELRAKMKSSWPMATGLSLLAWYIYAPQCLATLVVARRETNSWKWPGIMFLYLMALAYLAAFITFRLAS